MFTVKVLDRKPKSGRAGWCVWDVFRTLGEAMTAAKDLKSVKVFDGNRCVHHRGGEDWGT